jgi:hypothetical protein
MKISGFTFVRNATKYYFPIRESIESILPIVNEFVIALGNGDPDDRTEKEILAIDSDKIKIIHRDWDEDLFKMGAIYSHETNFAKSQCSGDWCFYLQADEAVHEQYLPHIKAACEKYADDSRVEGFLFQYKHFWGDYEHVLDFHGWYNKEIRIVRNDPEIVSIGDAQSFRKKNGDKLNVIELPAYIYHYGWVRPPALMRGKKKEQESQYWGKKAAEEQYKNLPDAFNYGALGKLPLFRGKHPAVMESWIAKHDWKNALNLSKKSEELHRQLYKHEKPKYRVMTWIEKHILGGIRIFGYKNWNIIGMEKRNQNSK